MNFTGNFMKNEIKIRNAVIGDVGNKIWSKVTWPINAKLEGLIGLKLRDMVVGRVRMRVGRLIKEDVRSKICELLYG